MNRWKKLAAGAVVAIVASSAGVAWANQAQDPTGQEAAPTESGTRALGGGTTETKFVPITPCRLVDTRSGTAAPAVGSNRGLKVRGTGAQFATQGGKPGGCGIPTGATAIEATITAVNPDGTGFLRAFPGSEPNATFLNYGTSLNPTNTGAVALCNGICLINSELYYKLYSNPTDVVIDVQGYYLAPMSAFIDTNGAILRSSRVSSSVRTAVGTYEVTFDRDISACNYIATSNYFGDIINTSNQDANTVFVKAVDHANNPDDIRFFIEVIC